MDSYFYNVRQSGGNHSLVCQLRSSNMGFSIVAALVIGAPAIALLVYIVQTGLWRTAGVKNALPCWKFIALTTASQVWVMVTWTAALFLTA